MVPPAKPTHSDEATSSSLRVAALLTVSNGFLDVYTIMTHGVFATAQTGNVVLFFVDLVRPAAGDPLPHLWPILIFLVGVLVASVLKTEAINRRIRVPLRYALLIQIGLLVVVSVLPARAPALLITMLIPFGTALQLTLFRLVRSSNYVSIASTGNLMRVTEYAFAGLRDRQPSDFALLRLYSSILISFLAGAAIGAVTTDWWGLRACWVAVAVITLALAMFFVDDYRETGRLLPQSTDPDSVVS